MLDEIDGLFGTRDLFAIIGIQAKDDSSRAKIDLKTIRDAYMKAAKLYHPDKFPEEEKELATKKFQYLGIIRKIMENEDDRKFVASTGEWPSGDAYDKSLFTGKVSAADLDAFKKEYQGSDEERLEIKKLYNEGNGSLTHIYENLFFANILDDDKRISAIIEDLVKNLEVIPQVSENSPADLVEERVQLIDQAKEEAKEAEEAKNELGIKMDDEDDLKSLILAKNKDRNDSFLASLEEKYGNPTPKKRGRKPKTGDSPAAKRAKNGNAEHTSDDSNRRVTRRMARSSATSSD